MRSSKHLFKICYSVEAGCLGAQGKQKIDSFCVFLTQRLKQSFPAFCSWGINPRIDIHQRHIQYLLNQKKLTIDQATRYLEANDLNIKTFENKIDDFVIDLIEEYLGR